MAAPARKPARRVAAYRQNGSADPAAARPCDGTASAVIEFVIPAARGAAVPARAPA
jgi:hypothetical protein